jgi:hypothetical protein
MDCMAALRGDFPGGSTDANDSDEIRTDDRLQSCRRHSPQGRGRVGNRCLLPFGALPKPMC